VLFFTHIPFVVNHTINATPLQRLQQHPSFLQRTAPIARSILLRSEIPSGMCAKLRTVATSNNRDHPTRSLYYCLFAPHAYIFVLRAHPVRGESHNQRNTTAEVATITSACCRSKHEVFKPLCEIAVKRNFSLEKSLITHHLRVRRVVFQVMHFATGDCSMKYQIC